MVMHRAQCSGMAKHLCRDVLQEDFLISFDAYQEHHFLLHKQEVHVRQPHAKVRALNCLETGGHMVALS
jgi:hypothetical protein